jgi:ribosomal subunit interface protein
MNVDDIIISGDDFDVSDAIKELIYKKYDRLLNHYGHFITNIEIILKIANDHSNIAESNVSVPEKKINASASTDDMYKSIDDMIAKLKIQLEKYKEQHFGHGREERVAEQFKDELTSEENQSLGA